MKGIKLQENAYIPTSLNCNSVDTVAPASMRYEMLKAIETIDRRVNGVDEYVRQKLNYDNLSDLCKAFSAEQVDAIAVAIYNIEQKGQSCIIGDQTGIGKGRIAAAMIRYATTRGIFPIFLTEKPNLFSDIYRDLIAIGADDGVPVQILCSADMSEQIRSKSKCPVFKTEEDNDDEDEIENDEESEDDGDDDGDDEVVREVFRVNKEYPYYTYETTDENGNANIRKRKGTKFLTPFIINGSGAKTIIKDADGNILYKGNAELNKKVFGLLKNTGEIIGTTKAGNPQYKKEFIGGTGLIPAGHQVGLATYSQFRSDKMFAKMDFLKRIAPKCIFILDESHNASGSSNSGTFLRTVLDRSIGACFLSATFAKRPDNMPIYASKTAISEANMDDMALVAAITKGGVALQEIISAQLVSEGQMIRRERSYEGIPVLYRTMDKSESQTHPLLNTSFPQFDKEIEHKAIADRATEVIRDIIAFQKDYVSPLIEELDKVQKAEYKTAGQRKGTTMAGVDNTPVFNGVFNVINQLLFALKAESVADIAIEWLKVGRKPVIAFSSTMESFLNNLQNEDGTKVQNGDTIKSDFSQILRKRLDGVLRYTIKDDKGEPDYETINVLEQDLVFQTEYYRILDKIISTSIGISCSPIDVVVDKIQKAGFSVGEVTGRGRFLRFINEHEAQVVSRVKSPANDLFRKFNNNQLDVLLINQSGSTGASAHAIKTNKVNVVNYDKSGNAIIPTSLYPQNEVKQRVMLVLQAELNISTEVQKRGRINRTGQLFKPVYEYITSAVPAEKRLMMMLQKKLKSLDANTAGNQKQSVSIIDIKGDFLNKYGDEIVYPYLRQNPLINNLLGDVLKLTESKSDRNSEAGEDKESVQADAAHKVSGRVAILSSKDQENFYSEMNTNYESHVSYLIDTGEFDLVVEDLKLDAVTLQKTITVAGLGGNSVFSRHSYLEKCEVNILKKPFKQDELKKLIEDSLIIRNDEGKGIPMTAEELKAKTISDYRTFTAEKREKDISDEESFYAELKKKVYIESRIKKIKDSEEREQAILGRLEQIESARTIATERIALKYQNLDKTLTRVMNFFYVGRAIGYPTRLYKVDGSFIRGVFLGFDINDSSKNPYAPSAIKARFALAHSNKYISIPLSKYDIISQIMSITVNEVTGGRQEDAMVLERWNDLCKSASGDRRNRYIVTGNILQAIAKEEFSGGKLVSYTVKKEDGTVGIKKGFLLPEEFNPDFINIQGDKPKPANVTVPIGACGKIVKGLVNGVLYSSSGLFSIGRKGSDFRFLLGNKKDANLKETWLKDEILLSMFEEKILNFTGGFYNGTVAERKIDNFLQYLQDNYRATADLTPNQFLQISDDFKIEEYSDEVESPDKGEEFLRKLTEKDRLEAQQDAELLELEALEKENAEFILSEEKEKETQELLSLKEQERRFLQVKMKLQTLLKLCYKSK
jgi:hypothetical protein